MRKGKDGHPEVTKDAGLGHKGEHTENLGGVQREKGLGEMGWGVIVSMGEKKKKRKTKSNSEPNTPLTTARNQAHAHLLGGDLGLGREIEVRVVGHDDAVKQDRHDPREAQTVSHQIRNVGKEEHEAQLQRSKLVHRHFLQQLRASARHDAGRGK